MSDFKRTLDEARAAKAASDKAAADKVSAAHRERNETYQRGLDWIRSKVVPLLEKAAAELKEGEVNLQYELSPPEWSVTAINPQVEVGFTPQKGRGNRYRLSIHEDKLHVGKGTGTSGFGGLKSESIDVIAPSAISLILQKIIADYVETGT